MKKDHFTLMKKINRIKIGFAVVGAFVLLLILAAFIYIQIINEEVPQAQNLQANTPDILLRATNLAEIDKYEVIKFTFRNHQYIWHWQKKRFVLSYAKGYDQVLVIADTSGKNARIWINNIEIKENGKAKKMLRRALGYFHYDSFVLNPALLLLQKDVNIRQLELAPIKVLAEKKISDQESQVFVLEFAADNFLTKVRLWIDEIPIKGVIASFSQYQNIVTDKNSPKLLFPTERKIWYFPAPIENMELIKDFSKEYKNAFREK